MAVELLKAQRGGPVAEPRSLEQALGGEGLMMKQVTSQCCRCLCCQPAINFLLQDYTSDWRPHDELPTRLFVQEESSALGRCMSCFAPASRSVRYTVHAGSDASAPVVMSHQKDTTLPHCCRCFLPSEEGLVPIPLCCCCCLPYLTTMDAHGRVLGTSRYVCDPYCCVPKFDVFDDEDERVYRVKPDTWCGGCCVRCRCGNQADGAPRSGRGRGKCCRVPFHVREPREPYEIVRDAALTNLWSGWRNECCTNKVTFSLKFPAAPTQETMAGQKEQTIKHRATLLGTALLLHLTETEHEMS